MAVDDWKFPTFKQVRLNFNLLIALLISSLIVSAILTGGDLFIVFSSCDRVLRVLSVVLIQSL